jgi:hypothetical protein
VEARSMQNKSKLKTESVEEFLARGGKINRLPPVENVFQEILKTNSSGPASIMSLAEADLFFGESKVNRSTKQKTSTTTSRIDLSSLPEALREKFLSKLRDEADDGEE